MTTGEIDKEDAALAALFGLAAATSVGIADVSLFSHSFSDTLFTLGDQAVTFATVVSAVVLGFVYVTNEPDLDRIRAMDNGDWYWYAVIATVLVIVAVPFVPSVQDAVRSNDLLALAVLAVESTGYVAISYLG